MSDLLEYAKKRTKKAIEIGFDGGGATRGKIKKEKCNHQWMKIKNIEGYNDGGKEFEEWDKKYKEIELDQGGFPEITYPPRFDKKGILVVCPNCEEQKELWEKE